MRTVVASTAGASSLLQRCRAFASSLRVHLLIDKVRMRLR
jgi:hypothetical protein